MHRKAETSTNKIKAVSYKLVLGQGNTCPPSQAHFSVVMKIVCVGSKAVTQLGDEANVSARVFVATPWIRQVQLFAQFLREFVLHKKTTVCVCVCVCVCV